MKRFITSLFQDKDGSISSKRLVMFSLVFMFLMACIVNLFFGKKLEETLLSSLVALIWYSTGLVFSENVTDLFKKENKEEGSKTDEPQNFQQKPPTMIP